MFSTTSTKDIVAQATQNPRKFAQLSPRYTCRYARRYRDLSEQKGYPIKCRDPRCSLECNANWSYKHGTCLARHLRDNLPEGAKVFKGHLTLPKNSTPEQHQAAKDSFLLALRRWGKRHGYRVELHAVLHITASDNAHWDYHLWTDAPYWPLRAFFNAAWVRAGGEHSSIVEPDSIDATARYQSAPVEPDPKSREILLPAPQKVSGLDMHWSTRGFWCGTSIDAIWRELIEEWRAVPVILASEDYRAVAECPECDLRHPRLCVVHSPLDQNKRDITDTPFDPLDPKTYPYQDRRYVPGEDRDQDRHYFASKLPTDPAEGVGLTDYATRWGVTPAYLESVLRECPGVSRTSDYPIGKGVSLINGWYREDRLTKDVTI